jgi:hypothetical protein
MSYMKKQFFFLNKIKGKLSIVSIYKVEPTLNLGLNNFLVPEFWKFYFLVSEFQFASEMIPQFWKMTE